MQRFSQMASGTDLSGKGFCSSTSINRALATFALALVGVVYGTLKA
jgi:hypothetical protein